MRVGPLAFARLGEEKFPRHPQVNEELAAVEGDDQVLAMPVDGAHRLAFQFFQGSWALGAQALGWAEIHARDAAADQFPRQPPADGLDLRQLRHARRLAVSRYEGSARQSLTARAGL